MSDMHSVCLRREMHTPDGLVPKGTWVDAEPAEDDGWVLHLHEEDGSEFLLPVPGYCVMRSRQRHETIQRALDARREFEHARTVLGFGHEDAARWVIDYAGVCLRTLLRWGVDVRAVENADRNARIRGTAS